MARKLPPTNDPVEAAWRRYIQACKDEDAAYAALNKIKLDDNRPNGLAKGFTEDQFNEALSAYTTAYKATFRAYDTWDMQRKRAADTTRSNVPVEDATAIVKDSLQFSTADLQWSINYGLLTDKMTKALFKFTIREEAQHEPICTACV